MPFLGLKDAARQAGISRSALHRAVQAGKVSAARTGTGALQFDPSELARAYPPPSRSDPPGDVSQGRSGKGSGMARDERDAVREALERELSTLRQVIDDLRRDRDRWAQQAQHLLLAPPLKRAWWPWSRRA